MNRPTITRAQYDAIMALQPQTIDDLAKLFAADFSENKSQDGMAMLGMGMAYGLVVGYVEEHGMPDASGYSLAEIHPHSEDEFLCLGLILSTMMSQKEELFGPEKEEMDKRLVDYLESLETKAGDFPQRIKLYDIVD